MSQQEQQANERLLHMGLDRVKDKLDHCITLAVQSQDFHNQWEQAQQDLGAFLRRLHDAKARAQGRTLGR